MYKKIIKKFIVISLIVSLNYLGFWAVLQADAFFNDNESAQPSFFATSFLDFSLESDNDFSPEILPGQISEREIRVANVGDMNIHYDIAIDFVNGSDDLCDVLDLEVYREGVLLSSSSLTNFSLNNLNLATNTIDVIDFKISLNNNDFLYQERTCEFDFVFDGEQIDGIGFSDTEMMANTVVSGTWLNIADYIVINKVYYDVDADHGREDKNEWIELYNPTDENISIKKWEICNHDTCAMINASTTIEAGAYVLISHDTSAWKYWEVPSDVQTINALGGQFEMDNIADMLFLRDQKGDIIDQMNWGITDESWDNYNASIWEPGVATSSEGHMLGRVPSGNDTDAPEDWIDLSIPQIEVINPNGGEVWWVGHTEELFWQASSTNESLDSELMISMYYSNDSGESWGFIGTTTNTGHYSFRVPLFLEDFGYYVPSSKARIKIIATGPENFMVQGIDTSDEDFCPPIDYDLLTDEEIAVLKREGLYKNTNDHENSLSELTNLSISLIKEEPKEDNSIETQNITPSQEEDIDLEIEQEDIETEQEKIEVEDLNLDIEEPEEKEENEMVIVDDSSFDEINTVTVGELEEDSPVETQNIILSQEEDVDLKIEQENVEIEQGDVETEDLNLNIKEAERENPVATQNFAPTIEIVPIAEVQIFASAIIQE